MASRTYGSSTQRERQDVYAPNGAAAPPHYPPQAAPVYPPYPGTYPTQYAIPYPAHIVVVQQEGSSAASGSYSGHDPYQPPVPNEPLASQLAGPANFGESFGNESIRRRFIRNVYAILMSQLAVTLIFICVFVFVPEVRIFVRSNQWFYYLSYAVFIITYIALACCPGLQRRHPINLILLAIFTLAFSYMTGTISSYYDTKIVVMAIAICTIVCLVVSLSAAFCPVDVTKWGWLMGIALVVLLLFSVVAIVFAFVPGLHTPWWHGIFSGLIALVFMGFLAYDTQMILGGKRHQLSPEEHVTGALQLYVDVVYIFLGILGIGGVASSN